MSKPVKSETAPTETPATETAPAPKLSVNGKPLGRKPVPENETDAQRFIRLAVPRTNSAIHEIELIGNLSGNGYEYSTAHVDSIFNALESAIVTARERFNKQTAKGQSFTL